MVVSSVMQDEVSLFTTHGHAIQVVVEAAQRELVYCCSFALLCGRQAHCSLGQAWPGVTSWPRRPNINIR